MTKKLSLIILIAFCSCQSNTQHVDVSEEIKPLCTVKYARNFAITYFKDYKKITLLNEKGENVATYFLAKDKKHATLKNIPTTQIIQIPATTIACNSTTELPIIEVLNLKEKLVGTANVRNIYSPIIQKLVAAKKIQEIGNDFELNVETILAMNPSILIASLPLTGNKMDIFAKLQDAGIKVIFNASYLEQDPLGRAEWIKFIAAFYNKEAEANAYFEQVEKSYLQLKEKISHAQIKPAVLFNIPFKDVWYVPGGKNYLAQLIKDAGGKYLWKNENTASSLALGFEAAYTKGVEADYWLHVGSTNSLQNLVELDKRYNYFKAVKNKQVYNNNNRLNQYGAYDYYESGSINPHLILADLIYILHPNILPKHTLVYYRKLE